MTYTTILHEVMKGFGLTVTEYAIMDTIYRLSVLPESKAVGWCYARKKWLGELFGIGRSTVFVILERLEKKQLLIRNQRGYLQATKKWVKAVELSRQEETESRPESGLKGSKSGRHTVQHLDSESPKSGHNNYLNNTIDNKKNRVEPVGSSNPLGTFERKGETIASKLIKKLHTMTGKGVMNKVMEASIITMLLKKGYKADELEGAIEWGVKEKGLIQMKQLPNIVDWYLSYLKREPIRRRREMEELGPGGREALEIMREK